MKKKQKVRVQSWSNQELADALMFSFKEKSVSSVPLRSFAKQVADSGTMGNMVFIMVNLLARISNQLDELIAKK